MPEVLSISLFIKILKHWAFIIETILFMEGKITILVFFDNEKVISKVGKETGELGGGLI